MIEKITNVERLNICSDYKVSINFFSHIYGYIIDNEIVGFIDFSLYYDRIELNYIYVLEKYRNKKIATYLMDKMYENNFDITLEVNVNNEKAINLYKKHKFNIINIRKGYYSGVDAYLMERKV